MKKLAKVFRDAAADFINSPPSDKFCCLAIGHSCQNDDALNTRATAYFTKLFKPRNEHPDVAWYGAPTDRRRDVYIAAYDPVIINARAFGLLLAAHLAEEGFEP